MNTTFTFINILIFCSALLSQPGINFEGASPSQDAFFLDADGTPWKASHGSPWLETVSSAPFTGLAARMWSRIGMDGCLDENFQTQFDDELGSEGIFYEFDFLAGQTYKFSFFLKPTHEIDEFFIALSNEVPEICGPDVPIGCDANPLPNCFRTYHFPKVLNKQIVFKKENFGPSGWQQFNICISPSENFSQLWITLKDDDSECGGTCDPDAFPSIKFGGVSIECVNSDDIVFLTTEKRSRSIGGPYFYKHNEIPPFLAAKNSIIIRSSSLTGVTIRPEDDPVTMVAGRFIEINTENNGVFHVEAVDGITNNTFRLNAFIDENASSCFNSCNNYFEYDASQFVGQAPWITSMSENGGAINGTFLLLDKDRKPRILFPEDYDLAFDPWFPYSVGFPDFDYAPFISGINEYTVKNNTTHLKMRVTTIGQQPITIFTREVESCFGITTADFAWSGEGLGQQPLPNIFEISFDLENCKGERLNVSQNVAVGNSGQSANLGIDVESSISPVSEFSAVYLAPSLEDSDFEKLPGSSQFLYTGFPPSFPVRQKVDLISVTDVSPNPVFSKLEIRYSVFSSKGEYFIMVLDVYGRPVIEETVSHSIPGSYSQQIDVSFLPSGIYTLKINSTQSGQSNSVKIIKT